MTTRTEQRKSRSEVAEKMARLKRQGLTYAEIGELYRMSRQRVQQVVSPPPEIANEVRKRANSRCENCKLELQDGDIHHKDWNVPEPNSLDNLSYLCVACHMLVHYDPNLDKNHSVRMRFDDSERKIIRKLRAKLGVDVTAILRLSIRKFAESQGITK